MFTDVSGYTGMSERLDPEELKDLMAQIFSRASAIVRRHGGTIDKLIGDCVMSVFGFRATREDDAVRALRAAREIRESVAALNTAELKERIGRRISVHSGVNTGIVVAGDLDIEKGTEKVLGDTVNVASRLCSAAGLEEIVVGRTTVHETERHFDFEELGALELKGKAEGVPAFRLGDPRTGHEGAPTLRGRRAEFTGRTSEMQRLSEALALGRSGDRRPVFIQGEAGSGKSRLAEELGHAATAEGCRVLHAYCYEHTQGTPYSLWVGLFSALFRLAENDSPETLSRAIEDGCAGITVEGKPVAPFISKLFAIESDAVRQIDAGFLKRYTEGGIVAVFASMRAANPPLVILDDLQWADPSSLEVLPLALREAPGLTLCLYRPSDAREPIPARLGGDLRFEEIVLDPLGQDDSEAMLRSLLDGREAPRELREYVSLRMRGNPFYIEETVNNLVESGALALRGGCWTVPRELDAADIPPTVQGIISARIDRLDPAEKRLLQAASVIGQNFLRSILSRLGSAEGLDESLELLTKKDLIRELRLEPDLEYMFKHALMREVVYESLLRKERRRLHEAVAAAMEELFPERIVDYYETIAWHYRQSENIPQAVLYLMKAGKKSIDRYAAAEANVFYSDAYKLMTARPVGDEDRPTLIRLLNEWGLVLYWYGDFLTSLSYYERHRDDAEALRDPRLRGMFWCWYAYDLGDCLRYTEAARSGEHALAIGREAGDNVVTCYALTFLGYIYTFTTGFARSIACEEEALALAEKLHGDDYVLYKCLNILACSLSEAGRRTDALRVFEREIQEGIASGNSRAIARGYNSKAYFIPSAAGGSEASEELFRLSFDYARDDYYRIGFRAMRLLHHLTAVGSLLGDEAEVERLAALSKDRHPLYAWYAEGFRAIIELEKGHFASAFRMLATCESALKASGSPLLYGMLLSIKGSVYSTITRAEGRVTPAVVLSNLGWILANVPFASGRAEKAFLGALSLAQGVGARSMEAQTCFDLGMLHKARKRSAKAAEWQAKALALYEGTVEDESKRAQVRKELEGLRRIAGRSRRPPQRLRG